jgi:23S rRNA pseudouridine2605 synthase
VAAPGHSPRFGLARALSKLGYCSRSQACNRIRAGHVRLNGVICCDPETPVALGRDRIQVDDVEISAARRVYLMLNKPRGVVTTASDERGRETVYRCLRADTAFIAPVGRLDKASEGLLLLTNDSGWAARILAPETHIEKTYHVQVGTVMDSALLTSLNQGMRTEAGFLRVKRAGILRGGEKNTWLEIVLDEGKNRHIRRMLEEMGIEVLRLVRVAIGPLALGDLAKGSSRPLTNREKRALDSEMEKSNSGRV